MKKLRVGVVGTGIMGRQHARVYSELSSVELVGVVDVLKEKAGAIAKMYNTEAFTDYNELIKRGVDAVSIVVPTNHHKRVALDFINNGLHVLVEKPITTKSEDASELIQAAEHNGVKLMVGHIERFNPTIRKLKELFDTGSFDSVHTLVIERVGMFPDRIKDEGVLTDMAVHDIDVANYLFDSLPETVYCRARNLGLSKYEDSAETILNYGNKTATIITSWASPQKIRRLTGISKKHVFELDYIKQELKVMYGLDDVKTETWRDFLDGVVGREEKIFVDKSEPLKGELEHFVDCIVNDKPVLNTGESARNVLRIAELCLESARTGSVIKLEE